jgi:hypothetical protein
MNTVKKLLAVAAVAGATLAPLSTAEAFWGFWPGSWFDGWGGFNFHFGTGWHGWGRGYGYGYGPWYGPYGGWGYPYYGGWGAPYYGGVPWYGRYPYGLAPPVAPAAPTSAKSEK